MDFFELKKNLKADVSALPKVRVALMGNWPSALLKDALQGQGISQGLDFKVFAAEAGQTELQALNPKSELYAFEPEIVILTHCPLAVRQTFYAAGDKSGFAAEFISRMRSSLRAIVTARPTIHVIAANLPEMDDGVYGSRGFSLSESWLHQSGLINAGWLQLMHDFRALTICDFKSACARMGFDAALDWRQYYATGISYSLNAIPDLSKRLCDQIAVTRGQVKKCVIVDLDNVLWGGLVGEDGTDKLQIGGLGLGRAFQELQVWLRELSKRGIVLAACSKNDEARAREPFERHSEMVLKLSDFSAFKANWENKAANIAAIQKELNVGFDSMVFLDDQPFERAIVRESFPSVCVPELPEDPAQYLPYLQKLNLFETGDLTLEDRERAGFYQKDRQRQELQGAVKTEAEFLESLQMVCVVTPIEGPNLARVSQLSQRSNQFNLRSVRYTEQQLQKISESRAHLSMTFALADRFGPSGLISTVILLRDGDGLFIDTWFMSCRVLKRGVEAFVLNELIEAARTTGAKYLEGEYLPTTRNSMVKDFYRDLGFMQFKARWRLDVSGFRKLPTFITKGSPS